MVSDIDILRCMYKKESKYVYNTPSIDKSNKNFMTR